MCIRDRLSVLLFVPLTEQLRGMLLGGVIIVILGIFDDIYALPAKPKFLVQIAAALVAVWAGNKIEFLSKDVYKRQLRLCWVPRGHRNRSSANSQR